MRSFGGAPLYPLMRTPGQVRHISLLRQTRKISTRLLKKKNSTKLYNFKRAAAHKNSLLLQTQLITTQLCLPAENKRQHTPGFQLQAL